MPTTIRPVRVNHLNLVLGDFDASVAHFGRVYGAEFLADMPQREFHACLIAAGRVIFELFVPHDYLVMARYGPHAVGIEYQADMDVVRAAVAERGIRIIRDVGVALHTDPADTLGVAFEFYGGWFHEREWAPLGGRRMMAAEDWLAQPLGLAGLRGYSIAVHDLDAARAFVESFLGGEPVAEEARPAIGARAVTLRVGDALVELLAPDGAGIIRDHLHSRGEGIRSTIFAVADVDRARAHFAGLGIDTAAGDTPGAIAVPAAANLGVMFEFAPARA